MSQWSEKMTKQQLLDYAKNQGFDLGDITKKERHDQIVEAVRGVAAEHEEVEETTQETTDAAAPEAPADSTPAPAPGVRPPSPPPPSPPPARRTFPGETLDRFVTPEFCSLAYIDAALKRTLQVAEIGPEEVGIIWADVQTNNYNVLVTLPGQEIVPTIFQMEGLPNWVAQLWASRQGPGVLMSPHLEQCLRELDARCRETAQLLYELMQENKVAKAPPHGAYVAPPTPQAAEAAPTPQAAAPRPSALTGGPATVETFTMQGHAVDGARSRKAQLLRGRDGLAVGGFKPTLGQTIDRYDSVMAGFAQQAAQRAAQVTSKEPQN